jgi:orotidine-5'-phosphate decarboxylase
VAAARRAFPDGVLVVPGIRLAGPTERGSDDQARVAGPGETIRAGADRIVVGRPITRAEHPEAVAEAIAEDIRRLASL